jgi:hypothetical protein
MNTAQNPYIFQIPLKLMSLKNQHMVVGNRMIRTPEYQQWERDTIDLLLTQVDTDLYLDKVYIHYDFRIWRDGIIDLGNLEGSIDDILQKCNIITDDEYRVLSHYFVSSMYCKENYGVTLRIWHGERAFQVGAMITRLHLALADGQLFDCL